MGRKLTDAERLEQIQSIVRGRQIREHMRGEQTPLSDTLLPPMTPEEWADFAGIKRPAPPSLQETQGATNTEADLTAVQNQPPSVNVNVDVDVSARESPRQVTRKGFLGRAFCWHDWSDYEVSPQSGNIFKQCYKCSKMHIRSGLL